MATMFRSTRILAMQPTRNLFMRQTPQLLMRRSPQLYMQQTVRRMKPVPKEEQTAHTISQRLRTLKNIPAEIWPLLIVLGVALVFAAFSLIRKLMVDKTLRLRRQAGRE